MNRDDGMVLPGGNSVRFAVGRPGFSSLVKLYQIFLKKWFSLLPCLAISQKNSEVKWLAALIAVPLGRHLTRRLNLFVVERWRGEHFGVMVAQFYTKIMPTGHELICMNKVEISSKSVLICLKNQAKFILYMQKCISLSVKILNQPYERSIDPVGVYF